jgi:Flp pilus assembly CpaE family ATPase
MLSTSRLVITVVNGLERLAEPLLRRVLLVRAAGTAVTGRVTDETRAEPLDRGHERQMSQ